MKQERINLKTFFRVNLGNVRLMCLIRNMEVFPHTKFIFTFVPILNTWRWYSLINHTTRKTIFSAGRILCYTQPWRFYYKFHSSIQRWQSSSLSLVSFQRKSHMLFCVLQFCRTLSFCPSTLPAIIIPPSLCTPNPHGNCQSLDNHTGSKRHWGNTYRACL